MQVRAVFDYTKDDVGSKRPVAHPLESILTPEKEGLFTMYGPLIGHDASVFSRVKVCSPISY